MKKRLYCFFKSHNLRARKVSASFQ